jgi:hypothetical protein
MNYHQLRNRLHPYDVLYTTGRGTPFTFSHWSSEGSLYFAIPSRTPGNKPNMKSIPRAVLTGQMAPGFTDCRLSVLKAVQKMDVLL